MTRTILLYSLLLLSVFLNGCKLEFQIPDDEESPCSQQQPGDCTCPNGDTDLPALDGDSEGSDSPFITDGDSAENTETDGDKIDGDVPDGDGIIPDGDDVTPDGDNIFPDGDAEEDMEKEEETLPEATPLPASISQVTSSTIAFTWEADKEILSVRIEIGAEPPSSSVGEMPAPVKTIELDDDPEVYVFDQLAPGVHHFIRITAETQEDELVAVLHARTEGGPRVLLDTAVRSTFLAAPDILAVVLANGDGPTYQDGPWSVIRENGDEISVQEIHRRSIPVGAPEYDIGWGAPYSDSVIDVDHTIYLQLEEPVGNREILTVNGPDEIDFDLFYSDRYLETTAIQVNQVGYSPRATQRYAYVYSFLGDGGVHDLMNFPADANVLKEGRDGKRVMAESGLAISLRTTNDPDAGGAVADIDIAGLTANEEKNYFIQVPGVGVSFPTMVSEKAVFKSFFTAARGLFHNRWGGDLKPECTEWSRPADHPTVYTAEEMDFTKMYPEDTPTEGERPLAGGYHDAGDFDQRPTHTIIPMVLMSAYELQSERFTDSQLVLPESGNGIPDLLDEALWGVNAWAALQDENGSVRMGVESFRHPWGFYLANEDPLPYWTFAAHQNITARAAGLFAQAARLVAPFDSERAAQLQDRAERAYAFVTTNPAAIAYMLYCAGEMYKLTGESKYREDFETAWYRMGDYGAFHRIALDYQVTLNAMLTALTDHDAAFAKADYLTAYLQSDEIDVNIRETSRTFLRQGLETMRNNLNNNFGHRNPRRTDISITWGKASSLGTYAEAAVAILRLRNQSTEWEQQAFDMLSLSADFMLGCNPLGITFYTGLGSRPPEEPLHLDSLVYIKQGLGPVPGIPVFGPTNGPLVHYWVQPTLDEFYPQITALPLLLRFGDVRTIVECSESTTWGDYGPNMKVFATLLAGGMTPPASWLPGGEDHRNPLP